MDVSVISTTHMDSINALDPDARGAIKAYETQTWAANLETPSLQPSWTHFLKIIEGSEAPLTERDLILVMSYLSVTDGVDIYNKIKENKSVTQAQFLGMLNRFASRPDLAGTEVWMSAKEIIEVFLVCYRTKVFPEVYNPTRLASLRNALLVTNK